MIIRDYQQRLIDETRAAIAAGHRRVLVVVPTGGGKTVVASEMIRSAVGRAKRVLFLAHREELLRQSVDKLAACGVDDVRVIRAGSVLGNHDAPVTVASIGTLCRPRWAVVCPPADVVVVDEAHHAVASTWRTILDRYPHAVIVGLTATPQRADGTPLGDAFQSMVIGPTVAELVARGHLVTCRVFAPDRQLEAGEVAQSPADAYALHGNGERAIVFCANVEHARRVAAEFTVPTEVITGETRDRSAMLARFASGETRVIVNVYVLTEGFDDPSVGVCILARNPAHDGTYLQMVGRVLRPSPGKTHATLIDLCGSVHAHGLPDEPRTYTLDGEGIRASNREALKQCTTCGACYRTAPVCPECGVVAAAAPASLPDVIGAAIGAITQREARPMPFLAMTSKFTSRCTACGGPVRIGDAILWRKGEKPHHARCGKAASVEELTRWVTG